MGDLAGHAIYGAVSMWSGVVAILTLSGLHEEEVRAELRLGGIDLLDDVRLAQVESDGRISVLRRHDAEAAQKRDLEERSG